MNAITKYVAKDGSEWKTSEEATSRELLCSAVAHVMNILPTPPPGVEEGKGWYQHDLEDVNKAKDGIVEICVALGMDRNYPVFKYRGPDCHALSGVGRTLSEGPEPLAKAWNRFSRIDEQGREHQQCYFAYTSGPQSNHVCLNP